MQLLAFLKLSALNLSFAFTAASIASCSAGPLPSRFVCDDPGPITVGGQETGYIFCTGGHTVREKAQACPNVLPRAIMCENIMPGGTSYPCTKDAECGLHPNGVCTNDGGNTPCNCSYGGCLSDADCSEGSICVCDDPVGHCHPALCRSNDDCKDGALCTLDLPPGCDVPTVFVCKGEHHECGSDVDCSVGNKCTFEDGHGVCRPYLCAGGVEPPG